MQNVLVNNNEYINNTKIDPEMDQESEHFYISSTFQVELLGDHFSTFPDPLQDQKMQNVLVKNHKKIDNTQLNPLKDQNMKNVFLKPNIKLLILYSILERIRKL